MKIDNKIFSFRIHNDRCTLPLGKDSRPVIISGKILEPQSYRPQLSSDRE